MTFSTVSPDSRVPAGHPIRAIKALADAQLEELSPLFDEMYSSTGRPSIPPLELVVFGEHLVRRQGDELVELVERGKRGARRDHCRPSENHRCAEDGTPHLP